MTQTLRLAFLVLLASTPLACTARHPTTRIDDAMVDAHRFPESPSTFTIELVTNDLEVTRGDRITLDVRIERQGGFAEPVLVELAGLPDPLTTQARESRVGDAITTLTIVTDEDGEPIARAAFVVQASTLEGLRQTAPAHITVR